MRDAHARGIDGFALNCGGWDLNEPHYKRRVMDMYEAAASLAFDFTLFVSADGRAQDEIVDIVESTRSLKAQLRIDGKPVVSAYGAGGKRFSGGPVLIDRAKKLGAFFVPHFFPESGERRITPTAADEIVQRLGSAEGYFYFGAAGSPDLIADSIATLSAELQAHDKLFMAPVTPYYRGLPAGTNYRAFETEGFSGMAAEWEAAIASDASWVQIVTWNDWAESTYVAPLPMPAGASGRAHVYEDRFGELLSHGLPRRQRLLHSVVQNGKKTFNFAGPVILFLSIESGGVGWTRGAAHSNATLNAYPRYALFKGACYASRGFAGIGFGQASRRPGRDHAPQRGFARGDAALRAQAPRNSNHR